MFLDTDRDAVLGLLALTGPLLYKSQNLPMAQGASRFSDNIRQAV